MIIKNAKVYTEARTFIERTLCISGGKFSSEPLEGPTLDAEGCYAIPGLIDMHLHGCKGFDFCDGTEEAIRGIAEYELSAGVTSIAPAAMTLPCGELERILAVAAKYNKEYQNGKYPEGAELVGVNMEGPFISSVKKGAQNERHIIPCNIEAAKRFIKAGDGLIKFIALAPEENPDFEKFISAVKKETKISLAHTNADYETSMKAIKAGVCHVVHLYNAMPPFSHRAPGVIGAILDSPHVDAELICDGVHIHPSVVRATFRMLGAERIILISDSMRAAGMPDGRYTLGGSEVSVTGNRASMVSDGALAGSVSNLMDCLRTAVLKMGISLEDAVACATINPARSLGIDQMYGTISPGKKADMLLLDENLRLKAVIKSGKLHCA